MSKQRLSLVHSRQRRTRVDVRAAERLAAGETELRGALRVDDDTLRGLHAQARALFHAGRYERVIDVLIGLSAIDDLDVEELLMLARAYRETGDHEPASRCAHLAQEILEDLASGLWAEEVLR